MRKAIICLLFGSSILLGIENYPYLTKPIPKSENKEPNISPKVKELDFLDKMKLYDRCIREGKSTNECKKYIHKSYEIELEYKP